MKVYKIEKFSFNNDYSIKEVEAKSETPSFVIFDRHKEKKTTDYYEYLPSIASAIERRKVLIRNEIERHLHEIKVHDKQIERLESVLNNY